MRIVLITFILIASINASLSQQLQFRAVFGQDSIRWDKTEFTSAQGERFRFSDLSFYLSEFSWYAGKGKAVHEHQRAELMFAGGETNNMEIAAPFRSDRVCFRFGLDSSTQVSGRTNGALDPALGMYWAWNTGYIQCRLEGYSPESKGKKGKFEFHLGGYSQPYPTDHKMCLNLPDGSGNPLILVDLKPLMNVISLRKHWSVLTPGEQARDFSRIIAGSFRIAESK